MKIKSPVYFDKYVDIKFEDGTTAFLDHYPNLHIDKPCKFKHLTNGYDSNGNRVTNLVGYDGNEFLKMCSRDTCRKVLLASEFGSGGRYIKNKLGERILRDQSNCKDCRK